MLTSTSITTATSTSTSLSSSSLDDLIDLKFNLEREINIISGISKKVTEHMYVIKPLFVTYQINTLSCGREYLDKQTSLLKDVDAALLKLCNHTWIEDTVEDAFTERNICYCNKCFVKK